MFVEFIVMEGDWGGGLMDVCFILYVRPNQVAVLDACFVHSVQSRCVWRERSSSYG